MVATVTIDTPVPPEDELYFFKVVTWSYAFLIEAGQPAFKELSNLLKTADPVKARANGDHHRVINNLRTKITHNLPGENKNNEKTRRQVEIWLLENGGQPLDWTACCRALCGTVLDVINNMKWCWERAIGTDDDRRNAVAQICDAAENYWPAHSFDLMVTEAATELGLTGFDAVAYRMTRCERWRELGGCFATRNDAAVAVARAIHNELRQIFGQ